MVSHLFVAKPVFEPVLLYHWFIPWEEISVKIESKLHSFQKIKSILQCRLQNRGHAVPASMFEQSKPIDKHSKSKPFLTQIIFWDSW